MHEVHEGSLDASDKRVAVVAARFNDFITTQLVDSALECLTRHGAASENVAVYWVPGAFEVPQMALRLGLRGNLSGIVCLGAIIRGETSHYDILCNSVIQSVAEVSSRCSIPVTFGIITADSVEQATDRAGGKNGNKGWESTLALVEMMTLWEG